MATTKYSHAFLVGSFNGNITPQDLNTDIWKRQTLTEEEYTCLLSDYYQSLIDSMVESEKQSRPAFLQSVCHYSVNIDIECKNPFQICLTKGQAEIPYDYTISLCALHLYFFPLDIVLVVLEIDDSGIDLNLMTLGHHSLINLKISSSGNEELTKKMKPLLDILDDHDLKYLVKGGNNMKIFQIIEIDAEAPSDSMLFEIGTFIPIGAVKGKDTYTPSKTYFDKIMRDNTISVFYNWKALALVDSFTVLGINGYNTWTWNNLYFPLVYLRCVFEKTFCFSRNSAYRLDKAVKNISQEISDMEKYYFYNNISYNFLPELLYDFMVKGIGLIEEREEISKQIKEKAKEEEKIRKEQEEENKRILKEQEDIHRKVEERNREIITLGLSVFAIFSVAWDFCSIFKDAFIDPGNQWPAKIIFSLSLAAIPIIAYILKKKINE